MHDVIGARAVIEAARGRVALTEDDAKTVLQCFGVNVPRRAVIPFGASAAPVASGFTGTLALKVVAPSILHKSDVGGVRLGLAPAALPAEIDAMSARLAGHAIEGWLVEEMVPAGTEIVIGGTIDARFGPTIMVGLGGVMVELFEDVCFGICPIRRGEAARMLDTLRAAALLRGWRGAPAADEAALIETMLRVGGEGGLLPALSDLIAALDINPLIVSAHGVTAVDARIVLRDADAH